MLLFVDIRRGGGSSEEISTEDGNSSENEQNTEKSTENVDNSGDLSTSDENSTTEAGENNSNGEVKANTANDLGVYDDLTDDDGNDVVYWISDSSYYSITWLDEADGTEDDPYIINSAEDLAGLSYLCFTGNKFTGCYFEQKADIDLSGTEYNADGLYWMAIGYHCSEGANEDYYFAGNYDGNNHTITNMTTFFDDDADDLTYFTSTALFGSLYGASSSSHATLSNLKIDASNSIGYGTVGAFVGRADNCTISNCVNLGCVVNSELKNVAGGIVGYIESVTVSNCINYASVVGWHTTGGIVGYSDAYDTDTKVNLIVECVNYGEVSVTSTSYDGLGGILGGADSAVTIKNCGNYGAITGLSECTGGIVGRLYHSPGYEAYISTISGCWNSGTMNVYGCAGGIVGGSDYWSQILNCYNTGNITGSNNSIGGICGRIINNYSSEVSGTFLIANCYNTGSVTSSSGESFAGILATTYVYHYDEYDLDICVVNCFNLGEVTGVKYVAGIVGNSIGNAFTLSGYALQVENCYYGGDCTAEVGYTAIYNQTVSGLVEQSDSLASDAKSKSWFLDASVWNANYPWDFDSVWVWAISAGLNDGYPVLKAQLGNFLEFDSAGGYWFFEDGMFPQSVVSDSTVIANLEAGAALSGGSYVVGSVVFDGWSYDGEEYVKVTASGANGTASDSGCTWFLVEPIVWIVGYGETLPTDFSTAVSAKIVTLGAYASSSANSTFVSLYSSTLTNALLALSNESLSISVSDSITYDLFNTTASQTAVFSVNLGNATSSNTTVTSVGYRVASVNEIDALGGAYATECSDFVAFLLSGGSSASGYVVDYWTRDLAYSLAADSYYSTAHSGKAYSYDGTYNQGVYVTSDGIISNATLKNVFGARLSVSV